MSQNFEPADGGHAKVPFAGASEGELNHDVEQNFAALIPIRDVYEPEVLRALSQMLPRQAAEEHQAIVLECVPGGSYVIGMVDPNDGRLQKSVARAMKVQAWKLIPRLVTPERFRVLLETAYGSTAVVRAEGEFAEMEEEGHVSRETLDWNKFDSSAAAAVAEQSAAVESESEIGLGTGMRANAERIILEAIRRRASDIHVIPGPGVGRINCRIDGLVYELFADVPSARMDQLANAFSDMAGVNGYELMQRGVGAEISVVVRTASGKKEKWMLRFHGRRTLYGRGIVIRINRPVFRDFDQIGFEDCQIEEIVQPLDHRNGVILVTGATGSGKSNTLEAMLRRLVRKYNYRKHVIQIGNPIEFPDPRRTQLPVDDDSEWGDALKDAMRMDPDIFSPGEFRDAEEAAIVFQGAATGHLTLTTLHTNSVAQTFSRLDFLKIGRDKQGDLIRLIISQELVPVLCLNCRKPDPRGREIAERLVEVVFPNRPDLREAIGRAAGATPFFHAEGCPVCHWTGIRGRTGIAEAMRVTPDVGKMLRQGVDGEEIVEYAVRRHRMMTLAESAARKLCRGIISFDHVSHLLITANTAAPEEGGADWDTSPVEADAQQPHVASDAPSTTEPEENYIEAEFTYTADAGSSAGETVEQVAA